ncbi:hypothetical protein PG996_011375 [Apiospora saccharicola]|uniref:Uncharacterized protein n=1 Tax=Apiospora saccharicola TaxID=335842 RepID=A0ABR1UHP7_9PEZI
MLFKKQHAKQGSKSSITSTDSQSSSTTHQSSSSSSSQGGGPIRDSTTALPKNVNSMRTWEVQTQQEQARSRASARGDSSYAHAGTDWDQKNEDLERRAQGLPLRSRSMKKSWKDRLGKGPGLGPGWASTID